MKIKLTQAGFETYNGQMGVIFFENGTSTEDVSSMDAKRIAAVMNAEWEDGSNLSPSQAILNATNDSVPVEQERVAEEEQPVQKAEPAQEQATVTQEELEAIADKQGIAGLRAIAEPLGIKARSITELIGELVNIGYATAKV